MNELNFVFKTGGHGRSKESDVYISHSERTKGGETTYFVLRNGVEGKIAPNTNCVAYAVSGSRLYFKEAPENHGYFLSTNSKNITENKYFSVRGDRHRELHDWARKNGGGYELLYDYNLKLWCIDVNGALFRGVDG